MRYLFIASSLITITALPNGAPVCIVGSSSTLNTHLRISRNPQTGTIESGGYQAILNGVQLKSDPIDPDFFNLFQYGVKNNITIRSGVGQYLKGILVIASGGDSNKVDILDTRKPQALTNSTPYTKESIGCYSYAVSSQVHTESSPKYSLTMHLQWPSDAQVLYLDVNVVRNNNKTAGSQYYFTQYPMRSADLSPVVVPLCQKCGLYETNTTCPQVVCCWFMTLIGLCDLLYNCRD
jgi:hypothetical protein